MCALYAKGARVHEDRRHMICLEHLSYKRSFFLEIKIGKSKSWTQIVVWKRQFVVLRACARTYRDVIMFNNSCLCKACSENPKIWTLKKDTSHFGTSGSWSYACVFVRMKSSLVILEKIEQAFLSRFEQPNYGLGLWICFPKREPMYKLHVHKCTVEQHAVLHNQFLKTSHLINLSCWPIKNVSCVL